MMNPGNNPQTHDQLEDFTDHVEDYVNTRYELFKLKLVDKLASVSSNAIAYLLLAVLFLLTLVLISIGVAVYINYVNNSAFSGFFIVSAFYVLAGLLCYAGKESILKKPLANKIIDKLLNN